jgi:hypothetical protein
VWTCNIKGRLQFEGFSLLKVEVKRNEDDMESLKRFLTKRYRICLRHQISMARTNWKRSSFQPPFPTGLDAY